jgi:hypothetical protein
MSRLWKSVSLFSGILLEHSFVMPEEKWGCVRQAIAAYRHLALVG